MIMNQWERLQIRYELHDSLVNFMTKWYVVQEKKESMILVWNQVWFAKVCSRWLQEEANEISLCQFWKM